MYSKSMKSKHIFDPGTAESLAQGDSRFITAYGEDQFLCNLEVH